MGGRRKRTPLVRVKFSIFHLLVEIFLISLSLAEKEVKNLKTKVEQFEGLQEMFKELLKMCEQFDARVRVLENQIGQVKETRDTFLKEISEKHEDFIRRLSQNQETLIKEAVEQKMASLYNRCNRCNPSQSSPAKLSPHKSSPSKFNPNIERALAAAVKTEMSKTDKAISSTLSPSAPEFVLPKNNLTNIPSDQSTTAPFFPRYRVFQDPRLMFQQSGGSQNPSFEPSSFQPFSLQHPGWYLGSPVVAPPVIVPDVSNAVGFLYGPTVNWGPKIMQANMLAHLRNLNK